MCLDVRIGRSFLNFPQAVQETPGYNGKRATATSAQHVTKIAEAGFNIKQSSIYIYLCDWSAINLTSLSTTPWANIVWVCNNSALDTAAPLIHQSLHCEHLIAFDDPTPSRQTANRHSTLYSLTSQVILNVSKINISQLAVLTRT